MPNALDVHLPRLRQIEAMANAGQLAGADAACRAVRAQAPALPEAAALHAMVLSRLNRFDEAGALLDQAIQSRATAPQWHFERARCHRRAYALDAALESIRRAVTLDPANPRYRKEQVQIHLDRGENDAARDGLIEVLAATQDDFDAHLALSHVLLATGEFLPGWAEYEWRLRSPLHQRLSPAMTRPAWNGMAMPGRRLLLVADQGFGDAIQFARFIPLAAGRCGGVTLVCPAPLLPLFARLPGVSACVPDFAAAGHHDAHAFLGSLPHIFGTVSHDIPASVPYLPQPGTRPSGPRTVGLVWAGNPENSSDWRRSIPLARLTRLAGVPGVRLVSLQARASTDDRPAMLAMNLVEPARPFADFADTAAAIGAVDLLISVDSAPAHLAGAMGRPVWVLVHQPADWRWGLGRTDSPWYPSMRLFRQRIAGDWDTPIQELTTALAAWAAAPQVPRQDSVR